MQNWTESEGQLVDGQFPLRRYLGGSGDRAVFLTERGEGNAAVIKLVPSSAASLASWEAAAKLEHPHLLRIFASGEYRAGATDCAYAVIEYADDNLGATLAERPLTAQETREMLGPVVETLVYLHGKGFAHGALKPANVIAVGDRVALSSESIVRAGEASAADDCLALGVILEQCMASLPDPLDEIARHCLEPNPAVRWTAARIAGRLRGETIVAPSPPTGASTPWMIRQWMIRQWMIRQWIGISAGAIIALVAGTLWYGRSAQTEPLRPLVAAVPAEPKPVEPPAAPAPPPRAARHAAAIVTQVLPDIPQKALDTITGRVRINVKVSVDGSGNVTDATLEPPLASEYFSQFTLKAARQWKFQPGDDSQKWLLRFELRSDDAKVSATPADQ